MTDYSVGYWETKQETGFAGSEAMWKDADYNGE
jgi:hypothetical protein